MITREQIPMVIDHPLYDRDGDKVGEIKHVYLDDATGRPEWLCVKTGFFGMKETFVPIRDANVVEDHVEVGYDKARIKNAPNVDVESGGHLSAEEERELYRYYELSWEESWQQANEPGQGGWAHSGGLREQERLGRAGEMAGQAPMAGGTGITGETTSMGRGTASGDAMTRSEEQLRAGTETHETGRARLRKYVVTDEEQVTVPVTREEVRIEREPITDANRGDALSGPDITESEHEVTLHEERPVVTTEAVPVEQVRMTKEEVTENQTVSGQVRKERIDVEGDVDDDPRRMR
ncbi:uncharacterized protein (TIGR02271 family) [Streptosporangium becharense]|uniref:Uncharacterized protein (TIGR02271 family) n=1 Tax=Streptosporangium becharense TaxID=1816182 RepID=A0A7W9MFN3_9ACTN|nr:PRC and DUF2382 domain-containing protein [Streptosporangium becharense]MBB2912134.1 uncharacterized protein (TIGR02271 family) [Streptosporangium becharense]MBB5818681.1 uncharacterized protein (TIGR02271 family) [Streptosporangium becharense]